MLLQALSPIADLIETLDQKSQAAAGGNTNLTNKSWAQESLEQNLIARNWVHEARVLLAAHPEMDVNVLARQASLRVFGTAPGAYGAGINRLAERSSAWQDRKQLGEVFIKRMGHVYGVESKGLNSGAGAQDLFKAQLNHIGNTYLGRASNLYGLIDNNDAFDYLGGLNLAIETVTGEQPNSFVISHANQKNMKMDSLQKALLAELRGRFLNPQWIKPLMQEGYAGARTMGSEFVEYLWGWQVTSPEIIQSWVWQDVKSVYVDDSLNLGLDDFLAENHNVHVQTNILAIMLVAIDKGFWQTDEPTQQGLAQKFAQNIIENGIPGSGHTHANHPVYESINPLLTSTQVEKLEQVLNASRLDYPLQEQGKEDTPNRIQEVNLAQTEVEKNTLENSSGEHQPASNSAEGNQQSHQYLMALLLLALLLMLVGFIRARRL
jgi:cobaltochelatase CobN